MRRTVPLALLALVLLVPGLASAGEPTKDATPVAEAEKKAPEPEKKAEGPEAPKKAEAPGEIKPPETIGEAMEDLGLLIEAAKNGNWVLFSGLLILLLIFILDKLVNLKARIPAKAVPWVAAVFGILTSIGVQLGTSIPWGQALLQGLTSGIVAVGLWEMIFKHALKKKPAE